MNALGEIIRALIEKTGPLPISRFMELALQHPEHGYYRHGERLGRAGDFITAPEVSQMFGEMIGLWCAEAWRALNRPEKFALLELGPGCGTLMQDLLRATQKISGFHAALDLYLLESNQTLRAAQEKKLAAWSPRYVHGIHELPEIPTLIIANEFFDALPIRQFENTADGWRERLVTVDGDEFAFALSPPDPAFLMLIPPDRREARAGAVYEVSIPSLSLMRDIAARVNVQRGALLMLDYGYAAPSETSTLQAVSAHRRADVLERPGEVDLTAHVDFAALKHVAEAQGAAVLGPAGQGEFLQTLGIDVRAMQLKHGLTPPPAATIDAALQRLTDPGQMGVLFKAMAIVSPELKIMPGF